MIECFPVAIDLPMWNQPLKLRNLLVNTNAVLRFLSSTSGSREVFARSNKTLIKTPACRWDKQSHWWFLHCWGLKRRKPDLDLGEGTSHVQLRWVPPHPSRGLCQSYATISIFCPHCTWEIFQCIIIDSEPLCRGCSSKLGHVLSCSLMYRHHQKQFVVSTEGFYWDCQIKYSEIFPPGIQLLCVFSNTLHAARNPKTFIRQRAQSRSQGLSDNFPGACEFPA